MLHDIALYKFNIHILSLAVASKSTQGPLRCVRWVQSRLKSQQCQVVIYKPHLTLRSSGAVMLSPRGQTVLEAEIVSSASTSASSSGIWPRHVLRLCNLALSICVFHDKAQANDLHSTIRPMPSQYKFAIYSHLTCLDDYWQNVCRDD